MRVVVQKKPYRGQPVGSVVDVSRQTARVLMALGMACAFVEEAEPEPEPEAKPKRVYKRRDMQAD